MTKSDKASSQATDAEPSRIEKFRSELKGADSAPDAGFILFADSIASEAQPWLPPRLDCGPRLRLLGT